VNTDTLGTIETGNRPWVQVVITAPNVTGHLTDASTAITFSMMLPDGTSITPVSSPNADIVGPTAGTTTTPAGVVLTTTTWAWKVPLLAQSGTYTVRWASTAGLIAQDNSRIIVPLYTPFATP